MVYLVVGSWLEADGSGSLLRRRRVGVPVLNFDGVSGVVLLIATDEELGGAPSEGMDVASSSFPSF